MASCKRCFAHIAGQPAAVVGELWFCTTKCAGEFLGAAHQPTFVQRALPVELDVIRGCRVTRLVTVTAGHAQYTGLVVANDITDGEPRMRHWAIWYDRGTGQLVAREL